MYKKTRNVSVNSVWHQLQFHNDIIISLEALKNSHINTKKKYRRIEGINSSGNIGMDLVNILGVFKLSIFACENTPLSTLSKQLWKYTP